MKLLKKHGAVIALSILCCVGQSANAGIIGVIGGNSTTQITNYLNANGHSATWYGHSGAISAADYLTMDAVVMTRTQGDANLINFISNGGLLITEWNSSWALNTANLLTPTDSGHPGSRSFDPVEITSAGIAAGLSAGMNNPYLDGGQSQHYRSLTGLDSSVDVLMEWSRDNVAVAIGGAYGSGSVLVNTLDWADGFGAYGTNQSELMLLNMLNYDAHASVSVPEPSSIALLGLGLFGLGFARKKSQA